MKQVEGDLLKLALAGQFDVIVHGCNCFHTMGAGIAKPISRLFPEALDADKATPKGDQNKLGEISTAWVKRGDVQFTIVNAYTQFHFRGTGPKVNYQAITSCFNHVATAFPDDSIGYPMIGAGLAGGKWEIIAPLIDVALENMSHTVVILPSS